MANFKWTRADEIGHPGIDEQHQRLFLLAEAVAVPLVNSAGLVDFLWNWLLLHIASADRDLVDWLKSQESGGVA